MATIAQEPLGVYLFLHAADAATGEPGYPLGPALRR